MEVFIDMNDIANSKADLWSDRVSAFQKSGLSRKDWCQQNGIPQSTFSYWMRKIQPESSKTEIISDPVFARLPSEQEVHSAGGTGTSPVTVWLSGNIRIEIGSDCPTRLMSVLLEVLKSYV